VGELVIMVLRLESLMFLHERLSSLWQPLRGERVASRLWSAGGRRCLDGAIYRRFNLQIEYVAGMRP